ncbi:hypothetical protein FPV67DRAFT_1664183 [Lyophyllum atratum]|nr:hypothetical protein FPV67DRAFT_1664183 [Lyophyllum atratum]
MVATLHIICVSFIALFHSLHAFASPRPHALGGLLTRDIMPFDDDIIPVQCKAGCDFVDDAFDDCTTTECICKDSIMSSLGECLDCSVAISNSTINRITAQSIIDQLVSTCKTAGTPINGSTIEVKDPKNNTEDPKNGVNDSKNNAVRSSIVNAEAFAFVALLAATMIVWT